MTKYHTNKILINLLQNESYINRNELCVYLSLLWGLAQLGTLRALRGDSVMSRGLVTGDTRLAAATASCCWLSYSTSSLRHAITFCSEGKKKSYFNNHIIKTSNHQLIINFSFKYFIKELSTAYLNDLAKFVKWWLALIAVLEGQLLNGLVNTATRDSSTAGTTST